MEVNSVTKKKLLDDLERSQKKISVLERKLNQCKKNEILLREIHHRVRNNMQILSSLLRIQGRKIKDKESQKALKVCQGRIRSMTLIHEMFYRSDDLEKIKLAPLVLDLVFHLFVLHGVDPDSIKLTTAMGDIRLDIDRAVPFALIANELLTNSLKHAFPNGKKGEIQIGLHALDGERFEFVVSDNGIGLPEDTDLGKIDSFGLRLVKELVEQIDGGIELRREKGTTFKITC